MSNTISKMTPEAINAAAAKALKDYKSISGIADHKGEISTKYGKDNFKSIKAAAQAIKAGTIKNAGDAVLSYLTFDAVLAKSFSIVSGKPEFSTLCKYAGTKYGKDAAAVVVKDFYPVVDAAGRPLSVIRVVDVDAVLVYAGYAVKTLSAVDGVRIMESSLRNMSKTLAHAAKCGKDAGKITAKNVFEAGKINAVYCFGEDSVSLIKVDTKAGNRRPEGCTITGDAAAALIGKTLPEISDNGKYMAYSAYAAANRDAAKEANAKDAAAYRAAMRAGLLKDAQAAGVKTKPAQGKGKGKGKTKEEAAQAAAVSVADMAQAQAAGAAVDAFIAANNAQAQANKISLNA